MSSEIETQPVNGHPQQPPQPRPARPAGVTPDALYVDALDNEN